MSVSPVPVGSRWEEWEGPWAHTVSIPLIVLGFMELNGLRVYSNYFKVLKRKKNPPRSWLTAANNGFTGWQLYGIKKFNLSFLIYAFNITIYGHKIILNSNIKNEKFIIAYAFISVV